MCFLCLEYEGKDVYSIGRKIRPSCMNKLVPLYTMSRNTT